jgi:prevent-host-death family protein
MSSFWKTETVTAREFQNRPGQYLDRSLQRPVTITKNGRPRNVVLSVEEFERLKRRDRRVVRISELTAEEAEEMIAALEAMEIPKEAEQYNDEYPEGGAR